MSTRPRIALCSILIACFLVAAAPAGAKSTKLAATAVKISSAKGGVASLSVTGTVTLNKESKSVAVSIKVTGAAGPAQTIKASAKSKKKAKKLSFTTNAATALRGEVKLVATALKKSSKATKTTVLAPADEGSNPGGNPPTPPTQDPPQPPPADALGLTSIENVTSLTCGMIADNAYCGGSNTWGMTGASSASGPVAGLAKVGGAFASGGVTSVDTGEEFACGLKAQEAYCWGRNSEGQLGVGTQDPSSTPVKVQLPVGAVTQVSAGDNHACALVAAAVYCWGYANWGQVGNGAVTGFVLTPVAVTGMTGVTRVVAHDTMTCAIKAGEAHCWGLNKNNRFGPGKTEDAAYSTPTQILGTGLPASTTLTDIATGDSNSCALSSTGHMYCWGAGSFGELGIGSTVVPEGDPVTPTGMDAGVTSISLSFYHVCAVKNGAAYCWGNNWETQLGVGSGDSEVRSPAPVTSLTGGVAQISAGTWNTCAVMTSTAGYCWGKGGPQLVNGQTTSTDAPAPSPIIKITLG